MKNKGVIILIALIATSLLHAYGATVVNRSMICQSIENREPVGEATEFDADIGKIFCFTEFSCDTPPVTVRHEWIYNGNTMADVTLQINSTRWRTKSSKNILPHWTGEWQVNIYDEHNSLLKTLSFSIVEKETEGEK